jgi:membrane protease YdiL (CAAX protease family)
VGSAHREFKSPPLRHIVLFVMKKNIYTALAVLFFLLTTLIQNLSAPLELSQKIDTTLKVKDMLKGPWAILLSVISLIYLLIACIGLGYIIFFIINIIKGKKPPGPLAKTPSPFSEETASKVLFFSALTIFLLHLLPGFLIQKDKITSWPTVMFSLNGLMQVLIGIIVIKFIGKTLSIHINKNKIITLLKIYSALVPLLLFTLIINTIIIKALGIEYSPAPAIELLFSINSPGLLIFAAIQVILTGPLIEEMFFRGFLLPLFRNRYGFIASASMLSFFFASMHNAPTNLLPLFLISFTLCYIYEKTKSITAVFIFHAIHNGFNFLIFLVISKVIRG